MRNRCASTRGSRLVFQIALAVIVLGFVPLGCGLGEPYHRPTAEIPDAWHWTQDSAPPQDAVNGAWWNVFKDPKLDELEPIALEANQDLKAAVGRVDEARALARIAKADFFPELSASFQPTRNEQSVRTFIPGGFDASRLHVPYNQYNLRADFSYEIDVWGRIRHQNRAAVDRAEATVADFQAVQLTVTSDVALNYFLLRSLDAQVAVLVRTKGVREASLKLVESQFKLGAVDRLDVARAQTNLLTTIATLTDLQRQREQVVNVIAILCGKPASNLNIAPKPLSEAPPEIPAGVPSQLLERRPDVVRAEITLMAACEDIAVAKTAFFPRFSLTANGGVSSEELSHLLTWPAFAWQLAGNIMQPIFSGGRNKANLEASRARYTQAQAAYLEQILTAFKDTEDALIEIKYRAEQGKFIGDAVKSAAEATKIATTKYEKGQVSYLDVVEAQREQLDVELQAALVLGQRLAGTVRLIKAIGGGWHSGASDALPAPGTPKPDAPKAAAPAPVPDAAPAK